jgi:uncharacterized HAD superfamily protein
MINRIRIGIDFDGVISDVGHSIANICTDYFNTEIKKDDLFTYYFNNCFGVNKETEIELVNKIVSDDITLMSPVVPGCQEVLQKLWEEDRFVYIITARKDTKIVKQYMQKKFTEFGFKDKYNTIVLHAPAYEKGKICKQFKLHLFIEDHIDTVRDFLKYGTVPIILKQPWNKNDIPSPYGILGTLIKIAHNWQEVGQMIEIYKRLVEKQNV